MADLRPVVTRRRSPMMQLFMLGLRVERPPVHVSRPILDYALPRHVHRSSKPRLCPQVHARRRLRAQPRRRTHVHADHEALAVEREYVAAHESALPWLGLPERYGAGAGMCKWKASWQTSSTSQPFVSSNARSMSSARRSCSSSCSRRAISASHPVAQSSRDWSMSSSTGMGMLEGRVCRCHCD